MSAPSGPRIARCLLDCVVPLIHQAISDAGEGGERAHERKAGDVSQEANVVDTAVNALGAVAGQSGGVRAVAGQSWWMGAVAGQSWW